MTGRKAPPVEAMSSLIHQLCSASVNLIKSLSPSRVSDGSFPSSLSQMVTVRRPLTSETPPVSCRIKMANLRAHPAQSTIKAAEQGQCSHRPHNGLNTHLLTQSCRSHQALNKLLPKASGGFSHASRASMGIVFLPPQWPNQLWGHSLLLSWPFYSRPAQTLLGLNRGGTGREKAHAFTSASHAYKEKNQIAQTCTHAHTHL